MHPVVLPFLGGERFEALENLRVGFLQQITAIDGTTLVVRRTADADLRFFNPDGSEAATADGGSYTVDDITALTLTFD